MQENSEISERDFDTLYHIAEDPDVISGCLNHIPKKIPIKKESRNVDKPLWAKEPKEMTVDELTTWAKSRIILSLAYSNFHNIVWEVVATAYANGNRAAWDKVRKEDTQHAKLP